MTEITIGVDISKANLDVHHLQNGTSWRFDNSKQGFRDLVKWIGKTPPTRIVFEATGRYHKALEVALGEKLPPVKVNPLQAKQFARACGNRVWTDAVDAGMLATMGDALNLAPQRIDSEETRELKDLHMARLGLTKDRTRLRNRIEGQENAFVKRSLERCLACVERELKTTEREIKTLIEQSRSLGRTSRILVSIPGFGETTAAAIIALLPEIGTLNRKQAASLAGLAPFARQSGQWTGKTFIQGGRRLLRRTLYMPALTAARHNPVFNAKYDKLVADGKPPKVALIAVMRKLVELANALVRADQEWSKNFQKGG